MREGINIGLVVFLGVVGCLMVANISFAVEGVVNFERMRVEAIRRDAATPDKLNPVAYANSNAQLANLNEGLTIEDAMKRVAAADPDVAVDPREMGKTD
ncbi:MAG: hypothetical protein AAF078_14160 [Planctomycetota bacterium]